MSPVERTAAWVLNNGQYEEVEEDTEQNPDEVKHAEKVDFILYAADLRALSESCPLHCRIQNRAAFGCCFDKSRASKHRLYRHKLPLYILSHRCVVQYLIL